jgi:hypothetical protein
MANQASDVRSVRPASRTCWPARSPNLLGGLDHFTEPHPVTGFQVASVHSTALLSAKVLCRLTEAGSTGTVLPVVSVPERHSGRQATPRGAVRRHRGLRLVCAGGAVWARGWRVAHGA